MSELNLDGSHIIAKKGSESVAYQGRKKAKTTNILPITDTNGFIVASAGLVAGNHNNAETQSSNFCLPALNAPACAAFSASSA